MFLEVLPAAGQQSQSSSSGDAINEVGATPLAVGMVPVRTQPTTIAEPALTADHIATLVSNLADEQSNLTRKKLKTALLIGMHLWKPSELEPFFRLHGEACDHSQKAMRKSAEAYQALFIDRLQGKPRRGQPRTEGEVAAYKGVRRAYRSVALWKAFGEADGYDSEAPERVLEAAHADDPMGAIIQSQYMNVIKKMRRGENQVGTTLMPEPKKKEFWEQDEEKEQERDCQGGPASSRGHTLHAESRAPNPHGATSSEKCGQTPAACPPVPDEVSTISIDSAADDEIWVEEFQIDVQGFLEGCHADVQQYQ